MPTQRYHQLDIPASFRHARDVEGRIVTSAIELGYDDDDVFALKLSLEEALTNAIRHGNKGDQTKTIDMQYYVTAERVEVYIEDKGCGFDYTNVPDPTAAENLESPSGRGIMLMRAFMDTVEYNDKGNVVHMIKLKSTERENKNQ